MLVPAHENFLRQIIPPSVPQLANLDAEIGRVLENKEESSDIKLQKYNQILRRYMKLQDDQQPQHQTAQNQQMQERPTVSNRDTNTVSGADATAREDESAASSEIPFSDETILQGIPVKNKKAASLLLHHVKRNQHLTWNKKGEMFIDGERHVRTNLIDLIHDFSHFRKTVEPAEGHLGFARSLYYQNVPRESIGNAKRWKLIEDLRHASLPFRVSRYNFATSTPIHASGGRSRSRSNNRSDSLEDEGTQLAAAPTTPRTSRRDNRSGSSEFHSPAFWVEQNN